MNNNHYKIYKYGTKLCKAFKNNKKNDCMRYLAHLEYHINLNTNSNNIHIGGNIEKKSSDLEFDILFKKINQIIKENPILDLSIKNHHVENNKKQIELYNEHNIEKIKNEIIELEKNIKLLQNDKLNKEEELNDKKILTINTILNKLNVIFNFIYGEKANILMEKLKNNLNKE